MGLGHASSTSTGDLSNCVAMILAAGLGSRLAPYTDSRPKPLLPLFDVPLIEYGVRRVVDGGIRHIVINTFHHCELLESFLLDLAKRLPERPRIELSREAVLLGTGGGIAQARPQFAGKTLLVVNSDLYFDFDLAKLARLHRATSAAATALLHEGTGFDRLRSTLVDDSQRITWIGPSQPDDQKRRVFAGIYLLEPEAYERLQPEPSSVIAGAFHPLMKEGRPVVGLVDEFLWRDLGTWQAYGGFCREVLYSPADTPLRQQIARLSPGEFVAAGNISKTHSGPTYIGPQVTLDPAARIGPGAVLQRAVEVGPHKLQDCVVLPATQVAASCEGVVVGPQLEVPLS
jgi:mannose-1-phosphate guanylyltransferase